jgi:hypothetical protein
VSQAIGRRELAALEAVLDPRVGRDAVPASLLDELTDGGLLDPDARIDVEAAVGAARRGGTFRWGERELTYGEVFDAFAAHCADELDDVEVLERTGDVLVARWRRETSRVELRAGFVGVRALVSQEPTLLLGELADDEQRLVEEYLDDAELRARVALCDLDRLERLGAVRSSVLVYLEWFLRDAYGVKLLPNPSFTRGLIERGVIHLGMG